jgi:hypothetical protein
LSQYRAAGGHFVGYEKLFVNHLNGIARQSWSENRMKNCREWRINRREVCFGEKMKSKFMWLKIFWGD